MVPIQWSMTLLARVPLESGGHVQECKGQAHSLGKEEEKNGEKLKQKMETQVERRGMMTPET